LPHELVPGEVAHPDAGGVLTLREHVRLAPHAGDDPVPDRAQNPAAEAGAVRHAQVELAAIARSTLVDAEP